MNSIKTVSFLVILLLFSASINAQLSVEKANGDLFEDGEVFIFNEAGESITSDVGKLRFYMFNDNEEEDITVKIEVKELRGTDGSNFIFCVQPLCIFAVQEGVSYPIDGAVISPQEYNSMDDYFINTDVGDESTTTIEYDLRFYIIDDEDNEIDQLTITYVYDSTFSNLEFDLPSLGVDIDNTQVKSKLNLNSADQFQVEIYNLSGKQVIRSFVNQGFNQVDMDGLSSGIYIARFTNQTGSAQIKLVKQ